MHTITTGNEALVITVDKVYGSNYIVNLHVKNIIKSF